MKAVMIGLTAFSCAMAAWGETFQMDRKGETTVEVTKASGEYRVTCMFCPQTKFDPAVNAKFNDAKGDSLCKKGLARYLKVGTNETLTVSGQYSAAPVATVGDRLCYSFGVPVAGCEVQKVVPKPEAAPLVPAPTLPATATATVATTPACVTMPATATATVAATPVRVTMPKITMPATATVAATPARVTVPKITMPAMATATVATAPARVTMPQVTTNAVQTAEPEKPVDAKEPTSSPEEAPKTTSATKASSFLCVTEYREVNGERTTVSRREYQGRNFKTPKEFDRFCRQEFARIRALGEANLRAVREFGR